MASTGTRTVHALLREWRGEMKLDRAAVYLSDLLGREVSRETIRRYEVEGESPKTLDPIVLAGLARVYGRDPGELPDGVVDALRKLATVVGDPDRFRRGVGEAAAGPATLTDSGAVSSVPLAA